MFKQRYLGNKKPAFLAGNTEQVHAAILESSKINDLFQNLFLAASLRLRFHIAMDIAYKI